MLIFPPTDIGDARAPPYGEGTGGVPATPGAASNYRSTNSKLARSRAQGSETSLDASRQSGPLIGRQEGGGSSRQGQRLHIVEGQVEGLREVDELARQ